MATFERWGRQAVVAAALALLLAAAVPVRAPAPPAPSLAAAVTFGQVDPIRYENATVCNYAALCELNVTAYAGSALLVFAEGSSDRCYVGQLGVANSCPNGPAYPEMNETGYVLAQVVNNTTPIPFCTFACYPTQGFSALFALYDAPSLAQVPVYANNSSVQFVLAAVDVGNVTAAPFVMNGSTNETSVNGSIAQFCNTTEDGQIALSGWDSSWQQGGVTNLWLGYPSANRTFNNTTNSGEVSASGFAQIVPLAGPHLIAIAQTYPEGGAVITEDGTAVCVVLQPVPALAPTVTFAYNATPAQVATNLTFLPNVTGGVAPFTYAWSFGDTTTSTLLTPVHAYTAGGDYTVTLTVTDALGHVGSASHEVVVGVPSSGGGPSGGVPSGNFPIYLWLAAGVTIFGIILLAASGRRGNG